MPIDCLLVVACFGLSPRQETDVPEPPAHASMEEELVRDDTNYPNKPIYIHRIQTYSWHEEESRAIDPLREELGRAKWVQECIYKRHTKHEDCNTSCDIPSGGDFEMTITSEKVQSLTQTVTNSKNLSETLSGSFGGGSASPVSIEHSRTNEKGNSVSEQVYEEIRSLIGLKWSLTTKHEQPCFSSELPGGLEIRVERIERDDWSQRRYRNGATKEWKLGVPIKSHKTYWRIKIKDFTGPAEHRGPICKCEPAASSVMDGSEKPTGHAPAPNRVNPAEAQSILTHADAFGIALTRVATRPETRTLKIHMTPPPQTGGDEFGDAGAVVAIVGDESAGRATVKTEQAPDGGIDLTLDVKELADVAGILVAFDGGEKRPASPIQYIDLNGGDEVAGDAPAAAGIAGVRHANGGRPNLLTGPTGTTPPVAIEGIWPADATVALGQGEKPTAVFKPAVTVTELNERSTVIARTTSGTFEGTTRGIDTIGILNEEGTGFVDGSARKFDDVTEGGVTSGPLTPTITAAPETLKVGERGRVDSTLADADVRRFAEANALPAEAAAQHLEVVIFQEGKEVASGVLAASYEFTAKTPNDLINFSSTVRWKDKSKLYDAVVQDGREALTATEAARANLPPAISKTTEANVKARAQAAKARFGAEQ